MRRASLVFVLLLLSNTSWAADASLKAKQEQARQQQLELRERIQHLQQTIERTEASQSEALAALKETESAISVSDRRLAEIEQRSERVAAHLHELNAQIKTQDALRQQRQDELAEQLRAMHASGLSPWAALLSGDNPQAIQRELGYLSYISKAQADKVEALRTALTKLAALRADTQANQAELDQLNEQAQRQRAELVKQQAHRATLLSNVEDELTQQRRQATTLAANDNRLGDLITGLEAEIERQAELARQAELRRQAEARRLAEEARQAELARQEQEAQRIAEARRVAEQQREQQAQLDASRQAQRERDLALAAEREEARRLEILAHSPAIEPEAQAPAPTVAAVTPPAAPERSRLVPPEPVRLAPEGGFAGLKQGLAMPVRGEIQGRFGANRPEGGQWRGVVIRANEGVQVNSVAAGRVVYANWLQGFGNLIILDHGQGHMTVYGYNQSLLKQVGDVVNSGEAIARVGSTGGQVEPGLYFEIRVQGQPANPMAWLRP